MSIWITFVGGMLNVTPGAYELVVSSLNVRPTARSTSVSLVSVFPTELPTLPGWNPQRPWSDGKPPFDSPLNEPTTGAPRTSATAARASPAPAIVTPPPAIISGLLARSNSFAALDTTSGSG